MSNLFHVSDRVGIERFEPRLPTGASAGAQPLVWAVDAAHLAHYLLPRDCPRVAFAAGPDSSATDRERFLGTGGAERVVAIESAWFERALSSPLWVYAFASESFACIDATAGYFVSSAAVTPLSCCAVERPIDALLAAGAELRVMPSLVGLAAAVAASTLAFSCIRMRNAGAGVPEARP